MEKLEKKFSLSGYVKVNANYVIAEAVQKFKLNENCENSFYCSLLVLKI